MNIFELIVLICVLVAIFFLLRSIYISSYEFVVSKRLETGGIQITATVEGYESDKYGRNPYYYVIYSYFIDKEKKKTHQYQNKQKIGWKHYHTMNKQKITEIDILYLASNPNVSRITGKHTDKAHRDYHLLISWIAFVVFPPIVFLWIMLLTIHYRRIH